MKTFNDVNAVEKIKPYDESKMSKTVEVVFTDNGVEPFASVKVGDVKYNVYDVYDVYNESNNVLLDIILDNYKSNDAALIDHD